MASTTQRLPKPKMRGLLKGYLRKHVSIGIGLGILASAAYKFGIAEPRKKAYAEFYKTYDPEEHYRQMKAAGVLPDWPTIETNDD